MKHLQLSDNNEKTEITESAQKTITVIFVLMIFFYISAAIFAVTILSRNAVFLADRLDLENALRVAEVKSAEERKIIGSVSETAQEPAPVQEAAPAEGAPAEEPVEEEPAAEETPEPENETKYYSFTSINSTTILHMREEPDLKAKSIYQLKPGTKGYVMELGDDWSRVYAKGEVGYCSNEFLSLTEISKEDASKIKRGWSYRRENGEVKRCAGLFCTAKEYLMNHTDKCRMHIYASFIDKDNKDHQLMGYMSVGTKGELLLTVEKCRDEDTSPAKPGDTVTIESKNIDMWVLLADDGSGEFKAYYPEDMYILLYND